jgi:hypothetical protein
MEAFLGIILFNIIVTSSQVHLEQQMRYKWVKKWFTGNITLEEIYWLKRQVWFRKAFKEVEASKEKKND